MNKNKQEHQWSRDAAGETFTCCARRFDPGWLQKNLDERSKTATSRKVMTNDQEYFA